MSSVKFFKNLFPFLRQKKASSFLLDISNQQISVFEFLADPLAKNIRILNSKQEAYEAFDATEFTKAFIRLQGRFPKLSSAPVFLSLDDRFLTTATTISSVSRLLPETEIDEQELESCLAKAVWELFDGARALNAHKMRLREADISLLDVRVCGVTLDNHKVINPVGFSAREIGFKINHSFGFSSLANILKNFVPLDNVVFWGEGGAASTTALSQSVSADFSFAVIFRTHVALYFHKGGTIRHGGTFPWGMHSVISAFGAPLGLPVADGGRLYELFLSRQISDKAFRFLKDIFLRETRSFLASVREAFPVFTEIPLYISSPFPLPEFLFTQKISSPFGESYNIRPVTALAMQATTGYSIESPIAFSDYQKNALLSAVVSSTLLSLPNKLDKIARRHARWLF